MDEAFREHQDRGHALDRARRTQRVADHGLGRGQDRKALRRPLQRCRPGLDLARVGACRRQVRVDHVHCVGLDRGIAERGADAAHDAVGVGRRHAAAAAVSTAVDGAAEQLGVDARAAGARTVETLEHEHPRAGPGNEATGAGAHRARGPLGSVVRRAHEHAHGVEPGPDMWARALRAAAQHALGEAMSDTRGTQQRRLRAGAAGARVGGHLVPEPEQTRDTCRGAARHRLLDGPAPETAHLARVGERDDPLRSGVHAADARAEDGARIPVDGVVVP